MKKYIWMAVGVFVSLGLVVTLVSGSVPFLADGQASALVLENGDVSNPDTSSAVVVQTGFSVVAEGIVLPLRNASLSMAASGIVAEVLAGEGEAVSAGQVIVRLQDTHQQASVAEAQAALDTAQAQLAALKAGSRIQEIAVAGESLNAARARLARLLEGARTEEIVAAQAELVAAQASLQSLYDDPEEQILIAVEADLANAKAAVRRARAAYDQVAGRSDIGMLPQSLELEQATNSYEAAQARYDALFSDPDAAMVANARARVKGAQAKVERLLVPATESESAEAEAMVRQAQAHLDLLREGARSEDIAAAAAAVAQAQAGLQQAQASLSDTTLRAPFSGTLAAVHVKVGEQVGAGLPVVELADLTAWQVETDDLTELDVVRVQEGGRVVVTFDAIEALELAGTIERIKPIGQEKLGDITYAVVIRLSEQDPRLRWNMTAVVTVP